MTSLDGFVRHPAVGLEVYPEDLAGVHELNHVYSNKRDRYGQYTWVGRHSKAPANYDPDHNTFVPPPGVVGDRDRQHEEPVVLNPSYDLNAIDAERIKEIATRAGAPLMLSHVEGWRPSSPATKAAVAAKVAAEKAAKAAATMDYKAMYEKERGLRAGIEEALLNARRALWRLGDKVQESLRDVDRGLKQVNL